VLSRQSIERAVRTQLADNGCNPTEFAVDRIVEVFRAARVEDIDDVVIDEGGGEGDPFALHSKVGEVVSDGPDADGCLQFRIGVHLGRTWHEIDTVVSGPGSAQAVDADQAVEDVLRSHGWVLSGSWTNDEWEQWVAPVRRAD